MTEKLQRLELTWPGKEDRFNPEPRILLEDKKKSYSRSAEQTDLLDSAVRPTFDNMLIHGDNLLALKALEQDYSGKIKCIYIDPPYNTGNAFEHYDDGLEHSIWLSLMRDRLEILKRLLAEDGSIFIQLDDNEIHYCKVLCDEIFGRNNFITNLIWHKKRGKDNSSRYFSTTHDHILVYAKDATKYYINRIELDESTKKAYSNPDQDPRGDYRILGLWARQQGGSEYEYTMKDGKFFSKRLWLVNKETMQRLEEEKRIVVKGNNLYRKLFLYENKGSIPETIWIGVSNNANAKDELKKLFGNQNLFDTPKPEALIARTLSIASNPGDLVLDSFLGSGTTAAVAQKMGRRWFGVEMGDHVYTHCIPRLKKVIDGEDQGGITKAVNWQGGGGFRFYELASSLIVTDKYGQQIISKEYNADMLAEAMCKILGYRYKPDKEIYWKQGFSSEKNFIYTTTMSLQESSLDRLAEEIGDNNLLICCSAFVGNSRIYPNISVKKIPAAILKKCEWGREGYPLNLRNYHPTDEEFEFEEE